MPGSENSTSPKAIRKYPTKFEVIININYYLIEEFDE